jgi:hypothetical protein
MRKANNEEMANVLRALRPGEAINVYGETEEFCRLANSLSRTTKQYNKTRFSVSAKRAGGVKITCMLDKKPETIIVI